MANDLKEMQQAAYEAFAANNLELAFERLSDIQEKYGVDSELANDLAVVLYRMGRTEEAMAKFREARKLSDKDDDILTDNLIGLLEEQLSQAAVERQERSWIEANLEKASDYEKFAIKVTEQSLEIWQKDSASKLHAAAQKLTDSEWANALFASVHNRSFAGHILPGFIDPEMQRMFVGSSGEIALREAQNFINVVLRYARENGISFDGKTRAVDFGSGWGRYTRFMLKYIHPDNLYALEVNPGMVEHCRKSFGMASFLKVDTLPPCDLRDNLVDLVFGYSVFSHLAPHCADAWIEEFARIMRPGGIMLMTTQGRSFIDYCKSIRESGNRSHPWYISLAKAFADTEEAYRAYDAGEFLHYGEGQYDGTYGETLIPRGYIEKAWLEHFELVDFVDDRSFLPQALFVLRRK